MMKQIRYSSIWLVAMALFVFGLIVLTYRMYRSEYKFEKASPVLEIPFATLEKSEPRCLKLDSGASLDQQKRLDLLMARTPTSDDGLDKIRAWLHEMAAVNPERAATWVEALGDDLRGNEAAWELAKAWAEVDVAAALAWAQRLPDVTRRHDALQFVCLQLMQGNPAIAVAVAQNQELGERKNEILEILTEQWAGQDLHAALDWAKQVPNETQRAGLLERVTLSLAQSDPLAAANLVASEFPAGEAQNRATLSVVHQWALRDPSSAAAWVSSFPDGALLDDAVRNLVGVWAPGDHVAVEGWLATLPKAAARLVGEQALQEVQQRLVGMTSTAFSPF